MDRLISPVRMSMLAAAILLIGGGSALVYRAVAELLASRNLVDHTHLVMSTADELFSNVARGAASANTFAVTGDEADLTSQRSASSRITDLITELRFLLADSPAQQKRLDDLSDLVRYWIESQSVVIETIRLNSASTDETIKNIRRAIFFREKIGNALAAISDEEQRLLRLRDEVAERDANQILSIVGVTTAGSIASIGILFALVLRESRRRSRALDALRELNAQMDARVRERTTELSGAVDALQTEIGMRRRSEAAEHVTRNMLEAVIDASPIAIICVSTDRTVLIWSRAAEQIFGYSRDEAIGRKYMLVPPGHEAEFDALFERALAGETLRDIEVRRQRKDGTYVDISFDGAVMRDGTGTRGVAYALTDVTRRKSVEQQLRQAQKMEAVGNLTGGMAHDFNNLLSIIIGNIDLLLGREAQDAETAELAREALDAALRGADLTQRLLAFARRQPLQPERVDVNALVAGIATLLRRTLGDDIELSVSEGADIWPVVVDPAQLESGLVNLANNARDAMPDGGMLRIATDNRTLDDDYVSLNPGVTPGEYAMIEVSDSGSGIAPDALGHIFEPFFTTKSPGKGTGLGLSMVFGFLKQSGGHVGVYSELGVGTTFRLYLPRAAADTKAPAPRLEPSVHGGSETILLVEDNEALRRVAARQLRKLGYRLVLADDGPSALRILEDTPVDLLFSDVVMPGGISGFELARTVLARWPDTRVLLASGFPEARHERGNALPPDVRLLTKPYRKEELARRLREALDGRG
jgi:PAS domain S-box-containing protein